MSASTAKPAPAPVLLGLPREQIIGRKVDDFAEPAFRPELPKLWRTLLDKGELEGTLPLKNSDGSIRTVEYKARTNVLPVRHVVALRESKTVRRTPRSPPGCRTMLSTCWMWMAAFGAWYAGAERIYGFAADQALGRHVSFLYSAEDTLQARFSRGTGGRTGGACLQ